IDWRDLEYNHCLVFITVAVPPCVSAFRFGMTDKIENFNGPLPCSLTLENFFYRNGFDVKRFTTMRCSDGIFKLRNLFRRHFPTRLQSPDPQSGQVLPLRLWPEPKRLIEQRTRGGGLRHITNYGVWESQVPKNRQNAYNFFRRHWDWWKRYLLAARSLSVFSSIFFST